MWWLILEIYDELCTVCALTGWKQVQI